MDAMKSDDKNESAVLCKKIQKILDLRLESDKGMLDSLNELSTFFDNNTGANRRKLKSSVERRMLDINDEFVKSLKNVQFSLDSMYKDVSNMSSAITNMTSTLSATKAKTRTLISETTQLQKQISDVETKQGIVSNVIERFQLKPSELAALRMSNVTSEMLEAIKRTKEIHERCKFLSQAGCLTLANDIMEQMTLYREGGLERLFRWTQARSRSIEQPDPSGILPQAVAELQSLPSQFDQIMEEYCSNRRDLLVRQLISALTRGGRPIEHRVTEPRRYVGDMLAWLHQAVPAERDNLAYLLKFCDTVDVSDRIQQALCSITEGVCHPLKVRIEHIMLGESNLRDPLLLQGVLSLLRYYHDLLQQVVGPGLLQRTLADLMSAAEKTLIISLTARVALLLGSEVESAPGDLVPPQAATKVLSLLNQVLSADAPAPELVSQTVSCVVDPLLVRVTESASRLPPVEMAVYLLNCYYTIESGLALHPYLDERFERLKAQSEAQMDTLTSEQASSFVAHLGLGGIYTALKGSPQKPFSQLPALSPAQLPAIVSKLEKVIAAPELYLLPQLALLSSVNQRLSIQKRAGAVIHSIYNELYNAVNDSDNLYPEPERLLPIAPEVVSLAFTKQ